MAGRSPGEEIEARASVVLGALLADAAAMGLHWLYDPDRIASIAKRLEPIFLPADQQHFEGAKGYFAHEGKRAGELSQYGAVLSLAMKSLLAADGRADVADYQRRFAAFFGPGGAWQGYIDRPTRGTLANLVVGSDGDAPEASGIDDDQMPSWSSVPAIVTAGPEAPSLERDIARIVRVTNDNPLASEAAMIVARTIGAALRGEPLEAALTEQANAAGDTLQPLLLEALAADHRTSVDIAGHFGRACHVQQGLPVVFHIAKHAESYEDAIRTNVMAGGDSCGRSIALGAILGARFGFGGERGMPLPWLTRVADGARLFDEAYQLAAL